MLLYALFNAAFAGTLPGIPTTLTQTDRGWTLSDSSGVLADYDGWTMTSVDGRPVDDIDELGGRVFELDAVEMTLVRGAATAGPNTEKPIDTEKARKKTLIVPINIAGVRIEETLPWPEGAGGSLAWATTRFNQPLLTGEGRIWSVNATQGEVVAAREGTTPTTYNFPSSFFKLEADWYIDGVAYSDATIAEKFSDAYILGRWKKTDQDVLLVPSNKGLEVHYVDLARHHGRFPTCDAGIPETCLTYGLEILAEMSEVEGALPAALAQFELGCQAGIGRACLEIVAQGDDIEDAELVEEAPAEAAATAEAPTAAEDPVEPHQA